MPTALSLLPDGPNYRREAFSTGLRAAGFTMAEFCVPKEGDVLLLWNRHPKHEPIAKQFEAAGATVLVTENGYFGKEWAARKWFALAKGHHNGAGAWNQGPDARWDEWGAEIGAARGAEGETVILAQRGIGEPGVASPSWWAQSAQRRYGGRIRPHPGAVNNVADLLVDLKWASRVITWGSSAALLAMLDGIEVVSEFEKWIGKGADRLAIFRRLIWAMWTSEEIESGQAFQWLLH